MGVNTHQEITNEYIAIISGARSGTTTVSGKNPEHAALRAAADVGVPKESVTIYAEGKQVPTWMVSYISGHHSNFEIINAFNEETAKEAVQDYADVITSVERL